MRARNLTRLCAGLTLVWALGSGDTSWAEEQRRSPHETFTANAGGATITITYGRPYVKGRKIFGGLEPYARVWRTGADEATTFETDKDLVIGGVTVPAGSYTLFTWLDEKAWKLVINKETGQWGLDYNQDQDLARIGMKTEHLNQLVEKHTIAIDPQERGGVLRIEWEYTRATVPFTVKQ